MKKKSLHSHSLTNGKYHYYYIYLLFLSLNIGCLNVASLDSFPKQKNNIDYAEIKSRQSERNNNLTRNTKQEYYFELEYHENEELLINLIKNWSQKEQYSLKLQNKEEDFLIFKRGMSSYAWSTMIGYYYDINAQNSMVKVYIVCHLTQDATGNFNMNIAEEFGKRLKASLELTNL